MMKNLARFYSICKEEGMFLSETAAEELQEVVYKCCVFYSKTGPAMNPALGTTWAFFEAGQVYPTESSHYIVYWLGSMLGGSLAALTWSAVDPSGPSGYLAKGKAKLE